MKYSLTFSFLFICIYTNAQDSLELRILKLLDIINNEKKMPSEFFNVIDSISIKMHLVVIQKTKENALQKSYFNSNVSDNLSFMILSEEEIFLNNFYFLVPSNIKSNTNFTEFNFATFYLSKEQKSCYKGKLKGKYNNVGYKLVNFKIKSIPCKMDFYQIN